MSEFAGFMARFGRQTKSYWFYNDTVEVRFDKKEHIYYLVQADKSLNVARPFEKGMKGSFASDSNEVSGRNEVLMLKNILDEKDYKKSVWDLVEPMVKLQKFSEVEAEG
jgi:hypothetical protein